MFLSNSHIMQFLNFFSFKVAKYAAFSKLTPHNSRKRLDTFLKGLGAVQFDNLRDSRWVKPCDLGNHSLDPDRKQPSAMMDFKPLNGCALVCHVSLPARAATQGFLKY